MALPLVYFNMYCPFGGIGRHAGLRSQCASVRVRVSEGAPNGGKYMKYTIIEDCSPYYIRFSWNGIEDIIALVASLSTVDTSIRFSNSTYTHYDFNADKANQIINNLPMKSDFDFMMNRVGLFVTTPGSKSSTHKDATDHRFSINLPIEILDNNCVTSWYNDEEISEFELSDSHRGYSRVLKSIDLTSKVPSKTMIAQPNECILFNTDVYHNWDNTQSINQRIVLTLRVNNPGKMYFDDAKKILFGSVAESGLLQQS